MKLTSKPKGWEHLFDISGLKWEMQTDGLQAIHVTIKGSRHIVVYAYAVKTDMLVVTYMEGAYSAKEDNEIWVGPMEAMCILLEALKEKSSISTTSTPDT